MSYPNNVFYFFIVVGIIAWLILTIGLWSICGSLCATFIGGVVAIISTALGLYTALAILNLD